MVSLEEVRDGSTGYVSFHGGEGAEQPSMFMQIICQSRELTGQKGKRVQGALNRGHFQGKHGLEYS